MRSVLLFIAITTTAGWAALRHLPASEADSSRAGPTVVAQVGAQVGLAGRVAQPALALPDELGREAAQPPQVLGVSLDGRHLPVAELRGLLATRRGATLDAHLLEQDRAAIQAALVGRGHLDALARAPIVTHAAGGAWVTFEADKGPTFRLRTITVTGATARDAGVVTLSAGELASAERIERARQTLADTLAHRGKPAEVTVTTHTDHDATVLDVELIVARR